MGSVSFHLPYSYYLLYHDFGFLQAYFPFGMRRFYSNYYFPFPISTYSVERCTIFGGSFNPEKLSEKTLKAIENFKSKGYTIIKLKNTWLDKYNPYNGINVTFKTQDGQYFEVQFHTKESFELKDVKMHELYEQQRTIKDKMSQEYIALYDKMQELSSKLTVPVNIERVKK